MLWTFHLNLSFPCPVHVVLEKNIFKWPHPIFALLWSPPPPPPLWKRLGSLFEQTLIFFIQEWFLQSLIEIKWLVQEKIFNKNICKNSFPYCDPSQPPGTIIWTTLSLHDVRKFSCKFEFFWPNKVACMAVVRAVTQTFDDPWVAGSNLNLIGHILVSWRREKKKQTKTKQTNKQKKPKNQENRQRYIICPWKSQIWWFSYIMTCTILF
jgi:hypothetical protein